MTMTLSGSGTIGGLVAGGLPDATVQPSDLATGAPSWDSSGNLSFNSGYGSVAKAYGCRAWVNFNGTGTVAIRASGNVSSITDNGTGDYTINFATALSDANYAAVAMARSNAAAMIWDETTVLNSSVRITTKTTTTAAVADVATVNVAIFR